MLGKGKHTFIQRQMVKQITVYPLKILYSKEKEQATNTPDNMAEPQQYYAE